MTSLASVNLQPTYPEALATYLLESFARMAEFGRIVTAIANSNVPGALHPQNGLMLAGMRAGIAGPIAEFLADGYEVAIPAPEGYPSPHDLQLVQLEGLDADVQNALIFAIPSRRSLPGSLPPARFAIGTSTLVEAIRNCSSI